MIRQLGELKIKQRKEVKKRKRKKQYNIEAEKYLRAVKVEQVGSTNEDLMSRKKKESELKGWLRECLSRGSGGPLHFWPKKRSVAALFLLKCFVVLATKTAQMPLKTAVAQRSGPFLRACTRSLSVNVAEFRYATLKLHGIPLTAMASVAGPALVGENFTLGLVPVLVYFAVSELFWV
jgi:hypothetical protein